MIVLESTRELPSLGELLQSDNLEQLLGDDSTTPPSKVTDWLTKLRLLKGVPFNYLVPDSRILPSESLRFFHLDINWINCLVDGAYSIGKSTAGQDTLNKHLSKKLHASNDQQIVTGFLLNSAVVSGWPGFQVKAYDSDGTVLTQIRFEHLSKNIAIGLYTGSKELNKVLIREAPEGIHFGLEEDKDNNNALSVTLRALTGDDVGKQYKDDDENPVYQAVSLRTQDDTSKTNRVIKVSASAALIKDNLHDNYSYEGEMTSAEYGLEAVKGVEEVEFING